MKKIVLILLFISSISIFGEISNIVEDYKYPIKNRYISTLIGTPLNARLPLHNLPKVKHRAIPSQTKRKIPDVFWFLDEYSYSLSAQPKKAPLVFVLPGIGGGYDGGQTAVLRDILYSGGFHVIALTNPTHPSFLITASSTGVMGMVEDDARDLYILMKKIYNDISGDIAIENINVVAYSLGATYSSYIAKYDSEDNFFKFNRVFMINPSVNILDSAILFDSLMENNLPNGLVDVNQFISEIEQLLVEMPYELEVDNIGKNAGYLLKKEAPEEVYQKLIGITFRNAISNIVFVSDVLSHLGQIVPEDKKLNRFSSLTEYYRKSTSYSFFAYFQNFLLKYLEKENEGYEISTLLEMASLEHIGSYLETAENIYVVTNLDELILTERDINFVAKTFKDRARFYPIGGHCGNMFYKENVTYMFDILRGNI